MKKTLAMLVVLLFLTGCQAPAQRNETAEKDATPYPDMLLEHGVRLDSNLKYPYQKSEYEEIQEPIKHEKYTATYEGIYNDEPKGNITVTVRTGFENESDSQRMLEEYLLENPKMRLSGFNTRSKGMWAYQGNNEMCWLSTTGEVVSVEGTEIFHSLGIAYLEKYPSAIEYKSK